jgi:hypothetical protein
MTAEEYSGGSKLAMTALALESRSGQNGCLEKRREDHTKDFRARPELEVGRDMQVQPSWLKARVKQSIIQYQNHK